MRCGTHHVPRETPMWRCTRRLGHSGPCAAVPEFSPVLPHRCRDYNDGNRCTRCLLPIGIPIRPEPAYVSLEDWGRIGSEIRAAELAGVADANYYRSPDEEAGWLSHSYDAEHEHDETAPYLAGWLGRQIYVTWEEP